MAHVFLALIPICIVIFLHGNVHAATVRFTPLADGFVRPVFVTSAPGDAERLYIVEKNTGTGNATGRINIIDRVSGQHSGVLLEVAGVDNGNEQGLLGLAFHPQFQSNRRFYVNYTKDSKTIIEEYEVSASDPQSAARVKTVMQYDQPATNHNGGWLDFSPNDGYLYIASGDGGSDRNTAQDITDQRLGKILRVDVDGDDFPNDPDRNYAIPPSNPFVGTGSDGEIWAYGLRNPWRPSFDRETGDFYIADVGAGSREEVDMQPFDSTGGENYGWPLKEGTLGPPGAFVDPIHDYAHDASGGFSITGGYVYRGPIHALQGKYFFADFVSEKIWSIEQDGSGLTEWTSTFAPEQGTIDQIASFGEDLFGNLYVVDLGGEIFVLQAIPVPPAVWLMLSGLVLLGCQRYRAD